MSVWPYPQTLKMAPEPVGLLVEFLIGPYLKRADNCIC